jgi:zinc/manganese transport system permease protein
VTQAASTAAAIICITTTTPPTITRWSGERPVVKVWDYLQLGFAQHALIAATLIAIISGLIGPFVVSRDMAFAVHGSAELAFTGAAAGLLIAGDAVGGALVGSLVVGTAIGLLGNRASERNVAIGVVLAFGLGLGVLLLSYYHGFASEATSILFGQILGVSNRDIVVLVVIAIVVVVVLGFIYRPLLFASIDPEVALARGVPTALVGLAFVYILAVTVTEAAQIVGTLLVLSLAITPAAAARRLTANPARVAAGSVLFALIAADGGLLLGLQFDNIKASFFISAVSFGIYLLARLVGWRTQARSRESADSSTSSSEASWSAAS